MAIKFETFDMPNASLRKKMKKIARAEAEAWKKSRRRG